jgi:hypothetical protein
VAEALSEDYANGQRRSDRHTIQEAFMRVSRLYAQSLLLAATASFFSADWRVRAQSTQSAASEQDLLLGSWRLDLAKSRYSPGPPPRNETRTYARDAAGVRGTIRRQRDDGRQEVIEYRADFDREYPVMGTEAYDTIRLKRIDARTAEAVLSHAGRVFGTARRVISEDGRTLTITFRHEDQGRLENNIAIYRKE